jgi:hypothetical protein
MANQVPVTLLLALGLTVGSVAAVQPPPAPPLRGASSPRGLDPRKDVMEYPLDVWTEQRGLPNNHVQALE